MYFPSQFSLLPCQDNVEDKLLTDLLGQVDRLLKIIKYIKSGGGGIFLYADLISFHI